MREIFEKIFDYMDSHPVLTAPAMSHIVVVFFVCVIISIAIGRPIIDVKLRDV